MVFQSERMLLVTWFRYVWELRSKCFALEVLYDIMINKIMKDLLSKSSDTFLLAHYIAQPEIQPLSKLSYCAFYHLQVCFTISSFAYILLQLHEHDEAVIPFVQSCTVQYIQTRATFSRLNPSMQRNNPPQSPPRELDRERDRDRDRDRRCAPDPALRPAFRFGVGARLPTDPRRPPVDVLMVVRRSAILLWFALVGTRHSQSSHSAVLYQGEGNTYKTVSVHMPNILLVTVFSAPAADL